MGPSRASRGCRADARGPRTARRRRQSSAPRKRRSPRLRGRSDRAPPSPPPPNKPRSPLRRRGLRQHRADYIGMLDVELAFPEALESDVVIAAQHRVALAFGVEHAAGGQGRVPDLLRTADHQTAFSGLAAAVHVAVADPPPLMCVALFLDHPSAVIDPGGAEKARDVKDVRQPIDANREVALELVGEILRQIGIGALVVDIGRDSS